MNEIIPIKKDILFKTSIGEITNIGLDYDYKINDDLIEGSIDISGNYKMLQTSVIEEDFFYSIPFSVAISENILKETIKIDIDDFKYTFDKDILNVSINLLLECDKKENNMIDNDINEYFNDINIELNPKEEINNIEEKSINIENNNIKETNITNNLFDIDNKYYTYRVYIVKPNDTLETISNKYNISIDDIKINNPDININDSLNTGDKLIIPEYEE